MKYSDCLGKPRMLHYWMFLTTGWRNPSFRKAELAFGQAEGPSDLLSCVSDLPSLCFWTPGPTGEGHGWHRQNSLGSPAAEKWVHEPRPPTEDTSHWLLGSHHPPKKILSVLKIKPGIGSQYYLFHKQCTDSPALIRFPCKAQHILIFFLARGYLNRQKVQ